jgi:KUP system potassium uptake protein
MQSTDRWIKPWASVVDRQDDNGARRGLREDEKRGRDTMPDKKTEASHSSSTHLSMPALSLAALGVVFGDIGTSPLYTLKTVLDVTSGAHSEPAAILGALSLILWTLIIVTSLKYVTLALRADNSGEGGILALMALLRRMHGQQPLIMFIGLCGAALVYGDATITPAISVMSALEGLNIVAPHMQRYVLPAAVVILVALFAVQQQGTARIGRLLGPVMLIWFATIALLGLRGIIQHPAVLWALNPTVGLRYLFAGGGITTLLVVGGVFLCVTGAEALYADLGHFGRVPIRLAWSCLVFPALVLNYAGQAAFVLAGAPIQGNIFYHLCPTPLLLPLVLLATVATVIASQAVITGAFSMTRQAIQLGLLPRLQVIQTSAEGYGQIYLPTANWLLMVMTLGLAIGLWKLKRPRRCLRNRSVGDDAGNHRFIGHLTVVPREDGKGLPRLVQSTFGFLLRNSSEAIEYFRLPRDMVVEIGRQFAI